MFHPMLTASRLRGFSTPPAIAVRLAACAAMMVVGVAWAGPPGTPPAPEPEPDGFPKPRFIAFVVPPESAGELTALRVRLEELYPQTVCCYPTSPTFSCVKTPCTVDDDCSNERICIAELTPFEGQFRYVNSYNGTTTCTDVPFLGMNFRCARLGCQPEYRDWAGELGGETLHVTGDTVAPQGLYAVSQIADSCGPAPQADSCESASPSLGVATGVWADVGGGGYGPPDGVANVIDVAMIFDKVRVVPAADHLTEQGCWLKHQHPDPVGGPINTIDIGLTIDATKGFIYPYQMTSCATPAE